MNRLLKHDRIDLDPNSPTAAKEWKHWFRTFDNFIIECGTEPAPDKFRTIINLISHNVFDYVEDYTDYDSVVVTLERLYIKSPNEIYARHLLATQQPGESLDEFLQSLRKLSKDCNLKAVSAEQYREELLLYKKIYFCGYCCLPTPMTLTSGGSPMFPLVVHQPAAPSIWTAVQSLRRGLSTNPGVTMWCVCGCS